MTLQYYGCSVVTSKLRCQKNTCGKVCSSCENRQAALVGLFSKAPGKLFKQAKWTCNIGIIEIGLKKTKLKVWCKF
uniref:Uncharacterized protein n=1 Tax=virus sp. ctIVh9 TaxID=2826797 RepID=A0A8S5R8X7_9VIRU|nr:MAG TPA: hypothetical protein [virus sp. ctIVh9]DAR10237.1 MAG TPA: hypothetical protein [Bacteriophage sp.]